MNLNNRGNVCQRSGRANSRYPSWSSSSSRAVSRNLRHPSCSGFRPRCNPSVRGNGGGGSGRFGFAGGAFFGNRPPYAVHPPPPELLSYSGQDLSSSPETQSSSSDGGTKRPIPGFYWDDVRQRYFRILPDQYRGCSRFVTTADEVNRHRRQELEQEEALLLNRPFRGLHLQSKKEMVSRQRSAPALLMTPASQQSLPQGPPLRQLVVGQEYGMVNREHLKIFDYPDETLDNCQFLDGCSDGRTVLGVWTIKERPWTRIMCLNVTVDRTSVSESSYGLHMAPTDNYIYVMERNAVDFCRAQMNTGVTCTLHITIPSRTTGSRVFLQPIPELCSVTNPEYLNSAMYNAHWGMNESAFSCTWDTNRMRMCLGMEKYGMILEVLNGSGFKLWSKNRHVLAPRFSKNGDLIFMGLRGSDIICSDLRRLCNRAVYTLPQTFCCSITLFADDRYMIASSLTGEVC
ncbi:unnamed protein product [Soboliphyme baturini]|uniref:WD repeat and SOCS box-containing protein 1 n=1 Tax=Soboliphyme baturini TaxID=241478 RepID=A0A183ISC7_9BILA|nr:unnamed protein product [Soboliphyme baturini]